MKWRDLSPYWNFIEIKGNKSIYIWSRSKKGVSVSC
jgi:hypothetical protein